MNERIKELVDQCTEMVTGIDEVEFFDKEKFAELIVRECFKVVDDFGVYQAAGEEAYLGENLKISMRITDAAWKIKEHFGVKE